VNQSKETKLKKQSFTLDPDLEQLLQQERDRFEREHGVSISLNQIATKAMRVGLSATAAAMEQQGHT
jgi:hypothetical protein